MNYRCRWDFSPTFSDRFATSRASACELGAGEAVEADASLGGHSDGQDGMDAFAEKRKPNSVTHM